MHPNLSGFWRFENTLLDASGNGNDGTVGAGSAAYADGKIGRAWVNNSTRYVALPNSTSLNFSQKFTLSAWVKLQAHQTGFKAIVSKWTGASSRSFVLATRNNEGNVALLLGGSSGSELVQVTTTHNLTLNQYTHVSASFEGGAVARIYVNGILRAESPASASLFSGSTRVEIGTFGSSTANAIAAEIDEVQIYNAALDANDIRRVMNGQMPQRRYA
jgi:hypothetical protein